MHAGVQVNVFISKTRVRIDCIGTQVVVYIYVVNTWDINNKQYIAHLATQC